MRVSATVIKLGKTSFTMAMRMRSRAQGRAIVAEGEAVLVMVDYRTGRKIPLSDELRRRIEELEASGPQVPPQDVDA